MKGLSKIISILMMLWMSNLSQSLMAQSSQEDYLKSNPDKKQFDNQQWGQLKGKMKSESSGSNSGGEGFSPNEFSAEQGEEGDNYDFQPEEYKGEFSEYQNNESTEEGDYEYDDEYDNYDHQDNYNYQDNSNNDGQYNQYNKPKKQRKIPKSSKTKNENIELSSGWVTFFKILGYVVIGCIIALVIYYLVVNYKGGDKGAKVHIDFDEVPPTEIPITELERRLRAALSQENYREAVRIYFIFIIKDLTHKNWINWKKEKTNLSYLMEMRNKSQYPLFEKTVNIYDIVWYGNYTITKNDFDEVEPTFKQLLTEIQK